jgi:hypothetical protein
MFKSALIGERFGKLTVVYLCRNKRLCLCDCGEYSLVLCCNLVTGTTTSCGCFRAATEQICSRTHGQTSNRSWTRTYAIWHGMLQRCRNPNTASWERYGGRGITVLKEWQNSFETFYRDMGDAPPGYSLERKQNDLGYSKENCVWATQQTQQRNRRDNVVLSFGGKTQCLSAWAEELGVNYYTLHARYKRHPHQAIEEILHV